MTKNFIKFNLKPEQEIIQVTKDKDNIGIIVCDACYEELDSKIQNFCNQVLDLLNRKLLKKVVSCIKLNFLCNSYINKEKVINFISKNPNIDSICVISCGLGIQFISDIVEKEVITLTNSVQPFYNSTAFVIQHGITLNNNEFFCSTCGQCYLNYTGGICPIVECRKSLLNGPCGGAKNGKCEVDNKKECIWEKIFIKQPKKFSKKIFFRNYYIQDYNNNERINKNLDIRVNDFFGGLNLLDCKDLTAELSSVMFPETNFIYLFLLQHIGKTSTPLVKEGDYVKTYQLVAKSDGLISSNLHSPISGKVLGIKELLHPKLKKLIPAIIIENDFKNEIYPGITPYQNWKNLSKQQIIQKIEQAGVVGLGGAMFPTHVKLSFNKDLDALIVNGCECEPYINADNRVMIEYTKQIFESIEIIKYLLNPKRIIIVIEDNKSEAIQNINQFKPKEVELFVVKTKYPYGAEKNLIKKLFNIKIPYNKIPLDFGFLIQNVSTLLAIYNAIVKGIPLVERIITVSGIESLNKNYGNYRVKIGTPINDIIEKCFKEEVFSNNYIIKYSGIMTGTEIDNFNTSIIKGCNGILAIEKHYIEFNYENKCIKCGRCVDVCPMELEPTEFVKCYQENKLLEAERYNVKDCIECGCCQHICSSKIPIVEFIKKEKNFLNKN